MTPTPAPARARSIIEETLVAHYGVDARFSEYPNNVMSDLNNAGISFTEKGTPVEHLRMASAGLKASAHKIKGIDLSGILESIDGIIETLEPETGSE